MILNAKYDETMKMFLVGLFAGLDRLFKFRSALDMRVRRNVELCGDNLNKI